MDNTKLIIYKCKICKANFKASDHDIMVLAFHITKHMNKPIMPHEAIKYYDMIATTS